MKFREIIDLKDNEVFKVIFGDDTEDIYRIHNNCLQYFIDNEWEADVVTSLNAFLFAKSIERI